MTNAHVAVEGSGEKLPSVYAVMEVGGSVSERLEGSNGCLAMASRVQSGSWKSGRPGGGSVWNTLQLGNWVFGGIGVREGRSVNVWGTKAIGGGVRVMAG